MQPLSFSSDPSIKATYIARAQAHRAADEIVQGTGWDGKNGCLVGCLAHAYPAHEVLATAMAVPEDLFHLADRIHEGLPGHLAKTWPERFISAIPVGVDLSKVKWRFLHWLLTDTAVNPGIEHELVREAVKGVSDLCLRAALGDMPSADNWSAAWSAAQAAAEAAAEEVEAAWSARSARSAAAWSARSAAAQAAAQAAEEAEAEAAWESISEKLLTLLAESAQHSEVSA